MRRRELLLASLVAALPAGALAQRKPVKIGVLLPRPPAESNYAPAFIKRLEELGYREGSAAILVYRHVEGIVERYPAAARELATEKCALYVAFGMAPAHALRALRSGVPTVFLAIEGEPVRAGLVSNLRRPDGNLTGVYIPAEEMLVKRIEILREVFPVKRLFLLTDPGSRHLLDIARGAAEHAGIRLTLFEFKTPPYDYAGAFEYARSQEVEAMMLLTGPRFSSDMRTIAELSLKHRLLSVSFALRHVEAGVLLMLSANQAKAARRTAELAVQVLKGAKPADIPVEQADEFELAINSTTANRLGVRIPESVLARATRIVQ